jgi:hypothetical protein
VSEKLQGPPSEPVEWIVEHCPSERLTMQIHTVARTAWQAHVQVGPQFRGNPAFGDCRVWRAQ